MAPFKYMDWIEQNSEHANIRATYDKLAKLRHENKNLKAGIHTKVHADGNRTQTLDLRSDNSDEEQAQEPEEQDHLG